MRVTFIDPLEWDYDCHTPSMEPLGGTQSALCYLSSALAALGVDVSIINGVSAPRSVQSVRFLSRDHERPDVLNEADVVVVISQASGARYRAKTHRPLALWTHHAPDQPAMAPLRSRAVHADWDAFILLSNWQRDRYVDTFAIDPARTIILRNGAPPACFAHPPARAWFETGSAPDLIYTSTPFRGLAELLLVFPSLRAAMPDLGLRVFSSMAVYRQKEDEDPFRYLYQHAMALPGVRYEGSVPQPALAEALNAAAVLAYPCTFAETSCIAAIEALACGASIVSTELGAIPETTAGFAHLVSPSRNRHHMVNEFAARILEVLRGQRADPDAARAARDRQIAYAREHLTWEGRAREWLHALEDLRKTERP